MNDRSTLDRASAENAETPSWWPHEEEAMHQIPSVSEFLNQNPVKDYLLCMCIQFVLHGPAMILENVLRLKYINISKHTDFRI